MRKKEAEIRDAAQIERILFEAPVMRLALGGGGWPYVVPLNFAFEPGRLWFHTGPKGEKMERLARDERVCFEVDAEVEVVPAAEPCAFGFRYRSVVGFGRAQVVEDQAERVRALNLIMKKYAGREYEFPPENLRRTVLVMVSVESMTGRRGVY